MFTKDELRNEIIKAAKSSWSSTNKVLLLSTLGGLEDGEIARSARAHAGSLKSFISAEVSEVRIIEHSRVRSLIGVIPDDVTQDINTILEDTRGERNTRVYFKEHFWNAFKSPLDASKRRFVVSHDDDNSPEIVDIVSEEDPPTNSHEVPLKLIDNDATSDEVYDRIVKWIKDTGTHMGGYTKTARVKPRRESRVLLHRLLDALDECDAKRVSLPLDIAQKLSRIRT